MRGRCPEALSGQQSWHLTIFLYFPQNGLCWRSCKSGKTGLFASPLNSLYFAFNFCWLLPSGAVAVRWSLAEGREWALKPTGGS